MGFLQAVAFDPGPSLHCGPVTLRHPLMSDHAAWAKLRADSRDFLVPWEPRWAVDELERAAFRRRLKRYAQEIRNDTGYPYFVFRSDDHELVGGLTLAFVRRGVTQCATLGYWMGESYAGKGLMTAAVVGILRHAFDQLQLHRVEAACLPSNQASIRLLEKVGFTREGYARAYLCINDCWQDHVLFAILAGDPIAGVSGIGALSASR
ncbi:MAG: GNAT family protein [Ancalomicrobiaceae bacterium]|nr:GNAT family protein [Ancalomicrobiaceae bacterium]